MSSSRAPAARIMTLVSRAEKASLTACLALRLLGLLAAFGIGLLAMPASTAILLLALGGGLQLAVSLTLVF